MGWKLRGQVPRPSGYMDQIRAFLVQFGQGLELETVVDDAGNVIIRKPATAGREKYVSTAGALMLIARVSNFATRSCRRTMICRSSP